MGDCRIIDLTVTLLLCAQPTGITATRDTATKYSIDHRTYVGMKGKHAKRAILNQSQCKDNIVRKNKTCFDSLQRDIVNHVYSLSQCTQWCLEKVACIHIVFFNGMTCFWVGSDPGISFRHTNGFTTVSILSRCPKYYTCADRACQNNATCKPLNTYKQHYLKRNDVGMECNCTEGWYGFFCERRYSCLDQLCQHGATCINTTTGFNCTCPPSWTGRLCERRYSCLDQLCQHGSTCLNTTTGFNCTCQPSWTGQFCERRYSCLDQLCQHGSTCLNTTTGFNCTCPPSWTGQFCERQYSCLDQLCQHGATCINTTTGFNCTCQPSWTGQFCERRYSCLDQLCQHGATCLNTTTGFNCTCPPSWTGQFCERQFSCLDQLCQNGATCLNTTTGFSCTCQPSWTGRFCESRYLLGFLLRPTVPTRSDVSKYNNGIQLHVSTFCNGRSLRIGDAILDR